MNKRVERRYRMSDMTLPCDVASETLRKFVPTTEHMN
jgi:hypothetical protein